VLEGYSADFLMSIVWKFRSLVLFIALLVGGVSIANLVAEFVRPAPLLSISSISSAPPENQAASAKLASTLMPFRSDLRAEYALALAGQALNSKQTVPSEPAQDAVISSLKIGPHDSLMWLVLALLQSRTDANNSRVAESLKMSYLTGQNRADLIPTRLGSVTSGNSLADADLAELARGDVRAILTQLPDQRPTLVADYARASQAGRQFLEAAAKAIDPKFVETFRK
jgi:hypothetical protein